MEYTSKLRFVEPLGFSLSCHFATTENKKARSMSGPFCFEFGGEGGIRTPGGYEPTPDFKSGAFNRTLPPLRIVLLLGLAPQDEANIKGLRFACKVKIETKLQFLVRLAMK